MPAEFGSLPERNSRHEETTISGPSFLGLTDSDDEEGSYLLDDEQPHQSHTGWVVFSLIVLVLLAGVGWLEWNAIKTGQIELPWVKSAAATPASTETAQNAAAAAGASEATANGSEQKPEADNAKDAASASSSVAPDAMLAGADSKKSDAALGTSSANGDSDVDATHAAQSRIATDAAHRRKQADNGNDGDNSNEDQAEAQAAKREPKAKTVKAEPKPDPRQDRMVVAGENYLYGRGVPQDCNQALVYFRAAAEKQNGPAMSHLGAMYASGHCVTQNKVAAYKWFSRA
ncbi:MAG TPA: tetratricopeptide repeat protein, partial [Phycisphaerae bacterium]|nr:tetratricopeptide repeat protein [Phycisphaerae bacterium]